MRRFALAVLFVAAAARGEDTVEHTRKNIRVLQGLPESQLFMAMNSIAQSLGVHCDYCHVKLGDKWIWESDEKRTKLIARDMIRMTRAISADVTCYSCHRGHVEVPRLPLLPPRDAALDPPRPAALPTAWEIVKRYIAAVGGAAFAPMVVELDIARSQGRNAHVSIDMTAADKIHFTMTTPDGAVARQWIDGTAAFSDSGKGPTPLPAELAKDLKRVAGIYHAMKVEEAPEEMRVTGIERIGDRDAYAVAAGSKTYFFDVESGLLLRERLTKETLLAPLPEQFDYDDYRAVGSLKLPFLIRTSDVAPYDTAARTITAIRLH